MKNEDDKPEDAGGKPEVEKSDDIQKNADGKSAETQDAKSDEIICDAGKKTEDGTPSAATGSSSTGGNSPSVWTKPDDII